MSRNEELLSLMRTLKLWEVDSYSLLWSLPGWPASAWPLWSGTGSAAPRAAAQLPGGATGCACSWWQTGQRSPVQRRDVSHSGVATKMCYKYNNCHSNVQFQKFCSFTWDIRCHCFLTQYNKCQSLIYTWRRETAGMCEGRMLLY